VPTGFIGVAAAGAGDAGDGDGDVAVALAQRALGHHPRHGLGHRAVVGDQVAWHAQHLGLGAVGVGDEAALEDVGGAGDRADRAGDQAAGAALGRDQPQRLPRASSISSRARVSISSGNM
jgi:hypothetical protein